MKTQLAALEINYLIKEFQFLLNSKIDKIYVPSKKEIILQLYSQTKGKQQLRITHNALFLTEYKSEIKEPSDYCMFLRKKLNNARVIKITQLEFERIISIEIQAKENKYTLIAELFSTGNILLIKDNKILVASEYQNWKDRTIRPKKLTNIQKKNLIF